MEEEAELNPNQGQNHDGSVPDLALTMQAMSLSEPGLCRIQDNQEVKQEISDFSCCLIMKVANTGATPRAISQQVLEESMARAWKEKFNGITQVSRSVFLAHFKSQEDMVSVYIKQPWVASSENLLVDWFDPNLQATSSSDFRFDNILVTVRAYGIPRNKRSITLLKDILKQIGEISDFHVLQESNLFAKQDYIYGTTKVLVAKPLKDKVIVSFIDGSTTTAYLHYEKIKRACLFCGVMFHNVQDCVIRNNLISERQKRRQSCQDIQTHRYGQWIINEKFIPAELIHNARWGDQFPNKQGAETLQRLRNIFAQDPKGKGEMINPIINRQAQFGEQSNLYLQQLPASTGQHRNDANSSLMGGVGIRTAIPASTQQIVQQSAVLADTVEEVQQANTINLSTNSAPERLFSKEITEMTQQQLNKNISRFEITPKSASTKRSAPSTDLIGQPSAKRSSTENAAMPTLSQCAIRDAPPYNPSLSLAHNAQLMDASLKQQHDTQPSILGAAPAFMSSPRPVFQNVYFNNEAAGKQKVSRWGQGTTHFTSGSATWKRHVNVGRGKTMTAHTRALPPASPCRSDATSAIGNSYEHDPRSLHTPGASLSQGTQDSRRGAFSPPHMTREYCVTPTAPVREEGNKRDEEEEQDTGKNGNTTVKAAAPAFKAP